VARRAPSASRSAAIAPRGTAHAKGAAFRTLDDINPDPRSPRSKRRSCHGNDLDHRHHGVRRQGDAHRLQDRAQNRLPASFFVSVAYDCWAFRRLGVELNASSGASSAGCSAIRRTDHSDAGSVGFMRTGARSR